LNSWPVEVVLKRMVSLTEWGKKKDPLLKKAGHIGMGGKFI